MDGSFNVSLIRSPMVYGGINTPGNMPKLINFAKKGFPIPILKNNKQRKDFINIYNLVDVLSIIFKNKIYGIILPTDKYRTSLDEIIYSLKKHAEFKVRILPLPKIASAVIKILFPNIYQKVYGSLTIECNIPAELYKPKYSLDDGIKDMINN